MVSDRHLLDRLRKSNGQTLSELCTGLDMTRQAVTKHLHVLEEANLVVTVRRGRQKWHYLNAAPIYDIADRWLNRYYNDRVELLADLKKRLEENYMDKPAFIYTTYIKTTPEELWRALTDPAFTSRYWGTVFTTDWQVGSTMTWEYAGIRMSDPEQVVLEAVPHQRLSYTWQTITPEFAKAVGWSEEYFAKVAGERRSKVTFEIESMGEMVRLTVSHDGFDPGSPTLESISGGWPMILSALKTMLETGDSLFSPPN